MNRFFATPGQSMTIKWREHRKALPLPAVFEGAPTRRGYVGRTGVGDFADVEFTSVDWASSPISISYTVLFGGSAVEPVIISWNEI